MPTIHTKPLSTNTRSWSDLDLDFTAHPVTKDIVLKRDVEAIKRSVRNLVLTNPHERPFHPEIGSGITGVLFELVSPTTAVVLQSEIRQVITNFEPRVRLLDIKVSGDIDNNGYYVTIHFQPINTPSPVTVELFLERLR